MKVWHGSVIKWFKWDLSIKPDPVILMQINKGLLHLTVNMILLNAI